MIRCHEGDRPLPLELAGELAVQRSLVGFDGQEEVGAAGGFDRAPQRFAIAEQWIETSCTPWDLGNSPIADRTATSLQDSQHRHQKQIAGRNAQAPRRIRASGISFR